MDMAPLTTQTSNLFPEGQSLLIVRFYSELPPLADAAGNVLKNKDELIAHHK